MRRDKALKYLKLAKYMAELFSKDPSTKVGAIFLAPESLQVLSMGYNGFPRGIDETKAERWERPTKYHWCAHAEQNACFNACRHGTPLEKGIAVVTLFPCCECSRALIQSGIHTLVSIRPDMSCDRWGSQFQISMEMFNEAGLELILFESCDLC
jgi:dCMP deaminase